MKPYTNPAKKIFFYFYVPSNFSYVCVCTRSCIPSIGRRTLPPTYTGYATHRTHTHIREIARDMKKKKIFFGRVCVWFHGPLHNIWTDTLL